MAEPNKERRRYSPREAREQAAEATGFLASIEIEVNGEVFEIPQRGLMDDEQRDALNEVELETESWDRNPDVEIPEQRLKDKEGNETEVIPPRTIRGGLKIPYRKGENLIKPAYPVRVAVAVLGEEGYKRFKAGGGRASDVTAILAQLDKKVEKRESFRSESAGGDSDMAAVADGD
jgi:hypothetical protein